MPKRPAVVIIARHGARLDAADKQWHLTSPTPYDPPLTYGGWSQAKALGLRVAALLHARENEAKTSENADTAHLESGVLDAGKGTNEVGGGLSKKRKKHKVVLHTSPFLRCIQTSTGIAAGIAQFQPPTEDGGSVGTATATKLNVPKPAKERNGLLGSSVLAKSPRSTSPAVQPVHTMKPVADPNLQVSSRRRAGPDKILLRIDAFLGEWLSPDYFDQITPPPNSTMMVAGAKADLLRRGDYVEIQPTVPQSKGYFPGGWKSNVPSAVTSQKNTENGPAMGSLAQALPIRERSSSQSGPMHRSRSKDHAAASLATAHRVPSYIYDPPIPSYAVSPSDPIPRGYMSHARDACVDVDWQWDSMREPQEWGDGGEYGDEWSTMHKRFRKGLAGMMKWYREHDSMLPKDQFPGFTFNNRPKATLHHAATDPGPKADQEDGEEDDEELVLVLVTHGAGCNALLGAISNQPVLIDVGLAALSMAVRRDEPRRPSIPMLQRRASVVDPGMSDTYEMKLLASLDHLRPGVDPAKPPQPQSPAGIANPSLEYRRRFGYGSGSTNSPISAIDSPFALGEPLRSGWNSSLGSMRRSSTSGLGSGSRILSSGSTTSPMPSSGLWSSPKAPSIDSFSEGRRSPGADMVLNFANQAPKPSTTSSNPSSNSASTADSTFYTTPIPNVDGPSTTAPIGLGINGNEDKEKDDNVAPLRKIGQVARSTSMSGGASGLWVPKAQSTVNGLWGPPRLEEVYEHPYDTPKRRWTVNETD